MTTTSKFHAGRLEFFDTATFEYMLPVAPIHFYEDFLGQSYVAVPAAGSAVDGCPFVKKIVGAGPPTLAGVANAIGGQVACTLGGDQRERGLRPVLGRQPRAGLHQGADLREPRRCCRCCRARPACRRFGVWLRPGSTGRRTTPATWNSARRRTARCWSTAFDGVTTTSVASGVTVGTTDWHIYRIDATNLTDVAFYIDGNRVNADNSINFAATGTLAVLQPYLAAYKASGTGVATLTIDYVRAWMNRQ